MRIVSRCTAPCRQISAVALAAVLALASLAQSASAQSSLGAPLSAATGRSQADAVSQNENELIGREVLGGPPGGVTAGRGTSTGSTSGSGGLGGAAAGLNTFTSGRVRGSDHDAFTTSPAGGDPGNGPFPYQTREVSTFGNVVVTVPGTVLGGTLKLSGFVGRNDVFLRLKSDSIHILDPDQSGKATNQSIMFGGTALWALRSTYALATVVGTVGQSTLKDSVDDCYPAGFCHHNRYNFNTTGIIASGTAGHVFDLGGGQSGPKLDLRGAIAYTHNAGDTFTNVTDDTQKYSFSTWTGTAGVTLFTNMAMPDNALLRPYIQGYVRQEWAYDNKLQFVQVGVASGTVQYDQAHLYGGVDAGLTYTQGNTTYGASVYYEGSGSERTLGGRLGFSQKLDSLPPKNSKPFNWSGFYVGLNAGAAWGASRINSGVQCIDNDGSGTFTCAFTTPEEVPGSTTAAPLNAAGSGTLSDSGFTGGVQGGYNLQTGGFVFGLELDFDSFRLGGSRSVTIAGPTTFASSFGTDWLFTARSRIGLPIVPTLLVYATTGFALTDLSVSNSISGIGASSKRGLVTGQTFGGGMEWALNSDWSLKGEYLYLNFGNVTTNAPTTQPIPDYNTVRTTADLTAHIVRLGLNYRF